MSNAVGPARPDPQKVVDSYFHQQATYWEGIYNGSGVMELVHQLRLQVVLKFAGHKQPLRAARVLDAGCGAGLATAALAKAGGLVYAVDSIPEMIELTRKAVVKQQVQPRVRCLRGNVQSLPFADHSFDLVIAAGVLPWVPAPQAALIELCRVLKPGGRIVLTTDNRWGLCWIADPLTNPALKPLKDFAIKALTRSLKMTPRARVRMTSIRECGRMLGACGLKIVAQSTVGFGPFSFFKREVLPPNAGLRLHRRLQRMADQGYPVLRWAGAQYVVMAEKAGAAASRIPRPAGDALSTARSACGA